MIPQEFQPNQQQQPIKESPGDLPAKSTRFNISASCERWLLWLLSGYFGGRLLFFALAISPAVPPDEVTHAGLCTVFSKVFLLPENSAATYQYGLATNIPWLYYWIMGKLLHLNLFGLPDLLFLRLLNIPLAFGTVWYAVRLLRLLTDDRLTRLLLVVVMTNIPMFSLLSSSISYDNLTNLLAAASIYYLFAFFRERSGGLLVGSLLCQLAGTLTKVTFLPLALALCVLLVVHEAKRLWLLPAAIRRQLREASLAGRLAAVSLLIVAGFTLHLYAGNYLRYGSLNPSMEAVISTTAAMEYRLDARGKIFTQYKEGRISYMDAVILAGEINHPGDKADTFYLLMNYEKMKQNPSLWLGPLEYLKKWSWFMLITTVGLKAHLQLYKDEAWLIPLYLLLGASALGFIIRWRPKDGWLPPALMTIALFYAGFIMYEFNYESYRLYGEPSLTVYGRYLFPVLAPCTVLFCRYLLSLFGNAQLRLMVALVTALLFIAYDFPWFLMHATPEWFSRLPQ